MRTVRARVSSAHVISIIALIVALSAGAYAASVAKNSVNSGSVKNESLRGKDVKNNTLTGKDVGEATLGQVPSAQNAGMLDNLESTAFLSSATGSVGPANLAAMPGARATATADQTINHAGTSTQIAFDTEVYDTGGMYTAPDDVLSVPRTGTYAITGYVNWQDADPDPERQLLLLVNATVVASENRLPSNSGNTVQSLSTLTRASAGDTISLKGRQTSGSSLTLISAGGINFAGIAAQWLGP